MDYLPSDFLQKMKTLLKEESEAFFATYKQEKTSGLRINPLKVSFEQWEEISPFAMNKIPFVENGYYYRREDAPGKHPYHAAGLYYIQEPSAMFVAEQLELSEGDMVLDLCAAPGGKTTAIAARLGNEGVLLSNEISSKRVKALSENVERFGLTNTAVINETPENLSAQFEECFDKIIVDAPCSGEGMFRKDPESCQYWSGDYVESCHHLQLEILSHAYAMLKKGGILLYSTCTFSPEENEQTIEQFVKTFPDMEILPIPHSHGVSPGRPEWTKTHFSDIAKTARLWPHHLQGEGHFVAKLRKTGGNEHSAPIMKGAKLPRAQAKLFQQFIEQTFVHFPFEWDRLFLKNDRLYFVPERMPDLSSLKAVRIGLPIGEFKKNRFEPHHSLALAVQTKDVRHHFELEQNGTLWERYLHGETIQTGKDRGWILLTIHGFPLGWGKEAKGIIKNFYPKGLRLS
ncbi:RsmF rRNA methyltransferase first C-terminal domain-containing protein [Bacillus sp. FSL W8-0223]|uniref:RsmF rRNA methyltransferase first C-terminal domain-containing protein n=1 Tax=Bacillus sp. FSL W8-0223 TaxID=2954595 RepID=UPI0030F51F45